VGYLPAVDGSGEVLAGIQLERISIPDASLSSRRLGKLASYLASSFRGCGRATPRADLANTHSTANPVVSNTTPNWAACLRQFGTWEDFVAHTAVQNKITDPGKRQSEPSVFVPGTA